jgi:hypothetical protein
VGATRLLSVSELFTVARDILGGRTYRRNDALPNQTLEAQIGLAQFGALLTELRDLRTLLKRSQDGRVVGMVREAED